MDTTSQPSSKPSELPSAIPSGTPITSSEASNQPSAFEVREFMILSKFKKLTDPSIGESEDENWCLQHLVSPGNLSSPLKMCPCDNTNNKQIWFYNKEKEVI